MSFKYVPNCPRTVSLISVAVNESMQTVNTRSNVHIHYFVSFYFGVFFMFDVNSPRKYHVG